MLLKLNNINKTYKIAGEKKIIVNSLNLKLDAGELVSITGRSGCGKSTLLNIISGIVAPDKGEMFYNNKKIHYRFDFLNSKRRNRDMGFIFQTFRLLSKESVFNNVLMPARIKGRVNKEIRSYADEVLGKLKIYKYKKSRVEVLSGGQKQRVAIARAMINSPKLILADEPTANLDKKTSIEIFDLLQGLRDEGRGVLIITHKDYIHNLSNYIYNMKNGILETIE
jgi:ABC-type lipoprotein export system ATPase subunit